MTKIYQNEVLLKIIALNLLFLNQIKCFGSFKSQKGRLLYMV